MKALRKILMIVAALAFVLVVAAAGWYFSNRIVIPELDRAARSDVAVAPGVAPATVRAAGDRLARLRRDQSHPAVSASVAVDGVVVWSEAQGHADLVSGRRASIETRFPIGSVSKALTATAAMLLVEAGKLDLDADVYAYVPEFPRKAHPITARQLLSHQAGIRHYRLVWLPPTFSEMAWNVAYPSVRASLALFADDPLEFEPDSSFQYSTYGYTLLSAALESAAKKPFLEFMREALFLPLSMNQTGADQSAGKLADRARDYIAVWGGAVLPSPPSDSSSKWAGGGFLSTPRDLVRFGAALLDDRIVAPARRALMFEPRQTRDGRVNEQNYGLGWRAGKMHFPPDTEQLVGIVHHGGTTIGAQSVLLLVPEFRVVVAISANSYTGGSGDLVQAAADIARTFMSEAAE